MTIEDIRDSLELCKERLMYPDAPVDHTVKEVHNRITAILSHWDRAHHLHQIMEEE